MQPNQRTISPRGIELITRPGHDACSLSAYVCPAGKVTIGYGHVLLPKFDYAYFPNTDAARLNRLLAACRKAGRITEEARIVLHINIDQACELLRRDTRQIALFLNSVTQVPLNQNQFDALCSLIFNIGQGNYAQSTLRKKLHDGKYDEAAAEFDRWVMGTVDGKQQKLPGLVTRRAAERALFEVAP